MALYVISKPSQNKHLDGLDQEPILGIDLETAGQDGLNPYKSKIRLFQMSSREHIFIIDLQEMSLPPQVRKLLISPSITKVFHNAKFDCKHLMHHQNLTPDSIFCTFLASQLLSSGNQHHRHGLGAVVQRYLNVRLDKSMQTSDWSGKLTEEQIQYAANDVRHLIPLYEVMSKEITRLKLRKVSQLEFRTVFPVAQMELNGIKLDPAAWEQLETKYRARLQQLEQRLEGELRDDRLLPGFDSINLNSPDQVKRALEKRGHRLNSTSEKELKNLPTKDPVIELLLEYRHASRILQSTILPFNEAVLKETGRVHPHYFQIASPSGRFSCSDPNIQQVPREKSIRAAFVPDEGNTYIVADYSQVELRVAAGLSNDPTMRKAYEKSLDLHTLTASLTAGKAYESISKQERQAAKAINFGLIYAMGPAGLQRSAKTSYGVEMSLQDAEAFHRRFFESYNGIALWHKQLEEMGRQTKYIRTAAGRLRRYHHDNIRITELFNVPVQGTAAEILKSALCIFYDEIQKSELNANLVAIIHDEILVETPAESAEIVRNILISSMKKGAEWLVPGIPFDVDANIAKSWAEKG